MKTIVNISTPILTAVVFTTLAVVWGGVTGTSHLPKPWLSLDREAKVLHLVCKPPPEACESGSSWEQVHCLELFHLRTPSSNVSLVNVTNMQMKNPLTNPEYSIYWVSFQGSWTDKSVSLEFKFPVTDKDLGRYFCVVVYSKSDGKFSEFSTQVDVKKDFVFSHEESKVKNKQNFEVSVVDAHKVRVTWTKSTPPEFKEASVSRVLACTDGKSIAPSIKLFTTDGKTNSKSIHNLHFQNTEVLLTKVSPRDESSNMSITLYVERGQHGAAYRYSCMVPYSACTGHNERFCTCCQQSNNPDREMCPLSPGDGPPEDGSPEDGSPENCSLKDCGTYCTLFILSFLALSFCVGIYVLFRCTSCSEKKLFQCLFTKTQTEQTPQDQPDETNPTTDPARTAETPREADPPHGQSEGDTNPTTDPAPAAETPREADPPHGQSEGDTNPTTDPAPAAGTPHEADPLLGQSEDQTNPTADPAPAAGTPHEADPLLGQSEDETNPTANPAHAAGTPIAAANLSQPEDTRKDSRERVRLLKEFGVSENRRAIPDDTRLSQTGPDVSIPHSRT